MFVPFRPKVVMGGRVADLHTLDRAQSVKAGLRCRRSGTDISTWSARVRDPARQQATVDYN